MSGDTRRRLADELQVLKKSRTGRVTLFLITATSTLGIAWLLIELLDFVGLIDGLNAVERVFLIITLLALIALIQAWGARAIAEHEVQITRSKRPRQNAEVELRFDREGLNLQKLVSATTNRLDLVGLSLAPFATEQCLTALHERIRSGVTVRILVLNPFSLMVRKRDPALYHGVPPLLDNIVSSIVAFSHLHRRLVGEKESNASKLIVRLYSSAPMASIFLIDSKASVAPYLSTKTGIKAPYFFVRKSSNTEPYLRELVSHIDVIAGEGISVLQTGWIKRAREAVAREAISVEEADTIEKRLNEAAL